MIDGDDCGAIGGRYEWQGKPKYSEKIRKTNLNLLYFENEVQYLPSEDVTRHVNG
jgi:hypothetical protein